MGRTETAVVTNQNLQSFFFGRVHEAIEALDFRAQDDTVHYLINLLALFGRSDHYSDAQANDSGKPLALMLADVHASTNIVEQNKILKRLGDIALFVSGFFSDSLNRKIIDIDYYVAMGGSAYGSLCVGTRGTRRESTLSPVFSELSEKFVACVDLLNEVSAGTNIHNDSDILRTYELWLRTGSKRAEKILHALGINPERIEPERIEPGKNSDLLFVQ